MVDLAQRIEHPFGVPVQGAHDADAREHRGAIILGNEDKRLHSVLPFPGVVLGLGKLGDVGPASFSVTSFRPFGNTIGAPKRADQGTAPPILEDGPE